MNKLTIIPCVIAFLQLISLGHLYYIHKYRSTQFPADLIELNILAILNIGVLILAYFLYFNSEKKTGYISFYRLERIKFTPYLCGISKFSSKSNVTEVLANFTQT